MPQNRMYDFSRGAPVPKMMPTQSPNYPPGFVRGLSLKGYTPEQYLERDGADFIPGQGLTKLSPFSQGSPAMSALVNSAMQPLFSQGLPPDVLFNALLAAFQNQY